MSESVMCVDRQVVAEVFGVRRGSGIKLSLTTSLYPAEMFADMISGLIGQKELDQSMFSFVDRDKAEEDDSQLQIIPYVVFLVDRKDPLVFKYQRTKLHGEQRLLGAVSVGVGGHINPIGGKHNVYTISLEREVSEELGEQGLLAYKADDSAAVPKYVICGQSSEVDAVHIGLVHVVRMPPVVGFDCEESMGNPGFTELSNLYQNMHTLESWSKLVVERLACDVIEDCLKTDDDSERLK